MVSSLFSCCLLNNTFDTRLLIAELCEGTEGHWNEVYNSLDRSLGEVITGLSATPVSRLLFVSNWGSSGLSVDLWDQNSVICKQPLSLSVQFWWEGRCEWKAVRQCLSCRRGKNRTKHLGSILSSCWVSKRPYLLTRPKALVRSTEARYRFCSLALFMCILLQISRW